MQALIEVIGAAIATDATKEQESAGVQACRTILAALDTEPGKAIVLPGTPQRHPLAGVSVDQILELMIARLTTIANAGEQPQASAVPAAKPTTAALPPTIQGLRVPIVPGNALKVAPRTQRPAPPKAMRPTATPRVATRK
jgi:hypothetical protein